VVKNAGKSGIGKECISRHRAVINTRSPDRARLEGEQRQQQAIALKMLAKNINIQTIAEVTGLTIVQL
jgi:hypothetical protein